MRTLGAVIVVMTLGLGPARGADPEPPARPERAVPADFKLVIAQYGVRKEPLEAAELVVRKGRAYRFVSRPPLEVIIHDPGNARLELVDLDKKLRSEIGLKKLDAIQAKLHDAIAAAAAKREGQGGRSNEVAASMTRDLIDPRFAETYDDRAHRLRLTNPSVEVDALGEPEADRERLTLIADTLAALVKLEAVRDPAGIPPFPRLEALRALTAGHQLRPAEMSFLYRLAGPPRKMRWTYQLVPELTAREVEAIARVDAMLNGSRFSRFEQYNPPTKGQRRDLKE